MEKTQHSELPWLVDDANQELIATKVDDISEYIVCTDLSIFSGTERSNLEEAANSEFIVRAVNSFYPMVEALEKMLNLYELMMAQANHKNSAYNSECIMAMNESPGFASRALVTANEIGPNMFVNSINK